MKKTRYSDRIKARAAELRGLIEAHTRELAELEVAERVLERLSEQTENIGREEQDIGYSARLNTKNATVADRAIEALGVLGPTNTVELLEHLQREWRADLAQTTLMTTLSRIKKEGRIENENRLWRLPESQAIERADIENNEQAGEGPYDDADLLKLV